MLMLGILPQSDSPKVRKAKECNLPYQENIADFLCSRVFSAFCDAGVAHFFEFFCPHPCVRTTDTKKGYVI